MNANTSHKGTGCGCGRGATTTTAICSCGGGGCESCQGQGIVRPRFFAGQLLTEDDLQLLTDYSIQKNRLHNRYLFGEGVVCGLEVTCHPCGDGQVIVHPGYALDCCGNDLTLDCAKTLNINKMIRDLRRDQLGGFDCGDPCPDVPKPEVGNKTDTASARISTTVPGAGTGVEGGTLPEEETVPARVNQYCLYIRYCEQPTDPVMPYSTGDDCGRQGCEATRVREGIKFELRCRPKYGMPNPLIARLCACLGDLNTLRRVAILVQRLKTNNRNLNLTLNKVQPDNFTAALSNLNATVNALDLAVLENPPQANNPQAAAGGEGQAVNSANFRTLNLPQNFTTNLASASGVINHFDSLPESQQAALLSSNEGLNATLAQGRDKIQAATVAIINDSRTPFEEIQEWLIRRLDNTPFLTDCGLRLRVKSLTIPAFSTQSRINQEPVRSFVSTNDQLAVAFIDYVRDCICRALNPACAPCEDSAVLLACFDVQDCKVVKICNLERTFVLSPAAVRYWLPPLQLLGNLIERLCCDPLDVLFAADRESRKGFNINRIIEAEVEKILKDSFCNIKTDEDWVSSVASRVSRSVNNMSQSFSTEDSTASRSATGVSPAVPKPAPTPETTTEAQPETADAETETVAATEEQEAAEGETTTETKKKPPKKPKAQG